MLDRRELSVKNQSDKLIAAGFNPENPVHQKLFQAIKSGYFSSDELAEAFIFLKENLWNCENHWNLYEAFIKNPLWTPKLLNLFSTAKQNGFLYPDHAILYNSFIFDPWLDGTEKLRKFLALKKLGIQINDAPELYKATTGVNDLVEAFDKLSSAGWPYKDFHLLYEGLAQNPLSAIAYVDGIITFKEAGWAYEDIPELYQALLSHPLRGYIKKSTEYILKLLTEGSSYENHSILFKLTINYSHGIDWEFIQLIRSIIERYPNIDYGLSRWVSTTSASFEYEACVIVLTTLAYSQIAFKHEYEVLYQAAIMHPLAVNDLINCGFDLRNSPDCPLLGYVLKRLGDPHNNCTAQQIVIDYVSQIFEHRKASNLSHDFNPYNKKNTVIRITGVIPSNTLNFLALYDAIHLAYLSTYSHQGPLNKNPATRKLEELLDYDLTASSFLIFNQECYIELDTETVNLTNLCRQANLSHLEISATCLDRFKKIINADVSFEGNHPVNFLPRPLKNALHLYTLNQYYKTIGNLFRGTLTECSSDDLRIAFVIGMLTAKAATEIVPLIHEPQIFEIEKALIERLSQTLCSLGNVTSESDYKKTLNTALAKQLITQKEHQSLEDGYIKFFPLLAVSKHTLVRKEAHPYTAPTSRRGIERLASATSSSFRNSSGYFSKDKKYNTAIEIQNGQHLPTIQSVSKVPAEEECLIPPLQMGTFLTFKEDSFIAKILNSPDFERDSGQYYPHEAFLHSCYRFGIEPNTSGFATAIIEAIPFVIDYLAQHAQNPAIQTHCNRVADTGLEIALRVAAAYLFVSETVAFKQPNELAKLTLEYFSRFVDKFPDSVPIECGLLTLPKLPSLEKLAKSNHSQYILVPNEGWFYYNKLNETLEKCCPITVDDIFPGTKPYAWKLSKTALDKIATQFQPDVAPHTLEKGQLRSGFENIINTFANNHEQYEPTMLGCFFYILKLAKKLYHHHILLPDIEMKDIEAIKTQIAIQKCQPFNKSSSQETKKREPKSRLTRILSALEKQPPVPKDDSIDSNIKQIVSLCDFQFWNQRFYGHGALNRMMLLDHRIADLLTPELIAFLFSNKSDVKIQRNSSGDIFLIDALFYGLNDGLSVIKHMPNNNTHYGPIEYQGQATQFEKNTLLIAKNIEEAGRRFGIEETSSEIHLFDCPLQGRFEAIVKSIARLKRSGQSNRLLAVPGYTPEDIRNQVTQGFSALCKNIRVTIINKQIQNETLDSLCEKFLRSESALLDKDVIHLFYDRAHFETALDQHDTFIHIGDMFYRYEDLLRLMINKLAANPKAYPPCAIEQFSVRLFLVESHIKEVEESCKDEELIELDDSCEQTSSFSIAYCA